MKIIVLLDGEKPTAGFLKSQISEDDLLYCADGAANFLFAHGISPNVLIGDMDSIDKNVLDYFVNQNIDIIRMPTEKDETDGQLIIEEAVKKEPDEIIVMGGMGNRLDHSLGNLQVLLKCAKTGIFIRHLSETEEIFVACSKTIVLGNKGDTVSVIPFSENTIVSYKGLKYMLNDFNIPLDAPLGISNVMETDFVEIDVIKGAVIIFHYF